MKLFPEVFGFTEATSNTGFCTVTIGGTRRTIDNNAGINAQSTGMR